MLVRTVVGGASGAEKVAVNVDAFVSATVQVVLVPLHTPPQPLNVAGATALAVKTTFSPAPKC